MWGTHSLWFHLITVLPHLHHPRHTGGLSLCSLKPRDKLPSQPAHWLSHLPGLLSPRKPALSLAWHKSLLLSDPFSGHPCHFRAPFADVDPQQQSLNYRILSWFGCTRAGLSARSFSAVPLLMEQWAPVTEPELKKCLLNTQMIFSSNENPAKEIWVSTQEPIMGHQLWSSALRTF